MMFSSSQREDKATEVDSPMLDHENVADTDVSDQSSIPDLVELTTSGECMCLCHL
jgi:hypothetical protein